MRARGRTYDVYIMASQSRTLYVGVTNDLMRRVYEHKHKLIEGFTSRYNINRLVWYAETNDVREAITREKQIKGWLRRKKKALIEENNPRWEDLAADWFGEEVTREEVTREGELVREERDSSLRSE